MNFPGKFGPTISDSHPISFVDVETVKHHTLDGGSSSVTIADAQLLYNGDYKRSGVDLILSKDGHQLVVPDYFKGEHRASLATPDGSHLTGDIVSALAGSVEYAQASNITDTGRVIGHVTKLTGTATAIRNGVSIILNNGDNVEKGDVVQSGSDSQLGITFIDGTVFGLSSNARMVLNEMVYDPNGSSNSSLLTLVAGTISFVAGETAKHGDMKVDTPTATMGIRGTAVLVEIDFTVPASGNTPAVNFQVLAEPDGHTGSYILYSKPTAANPIPVEIGRVDQSGQSYTITANNQLQSTAAPPLSPQAAAVVLETFVAKFNAPPPQVTAPTSPDKTTPNNANPQSAPSGGGGSSTPPPPATPLDTSPIDNHNTQPTDQTPTPTPISTTPPAPTNTTPPPTTTTTTAAAGGAIPTTITVTPVTDNPNFIIPKQVVTGPTPPPTFVAFVPGSGTVQSVTTSGNTPPGVDLTKFITIDETTGAVSYNPQDFAFLKQGQSAIATIAFQSNDGVENVPESLILTIDGTTPTGPVVTISNPNAITNAATQTISGTATGTAAPNDTITITDTVNGVVKTIGTATVANDGTWTTTVTLTGDGTHSISAQDTDANSNVGVSSPVAITLDTILPAVTINTSDHVSNAATQTISGTVTAGDAPVGTTVTLFDTVSTPNGNVTSQIGTATVGSDGHWTTQVTLAGDGAHSIVAVDLDAAGNIGSSPPVAITLDTVPPAVTINTQGATTNQATQTISGTVTTTEAAAGGTVTLFDTVNGVTTQIGTATLNGNNWSTSVVLSGDGVHNIVAEDTDAAGNTASSAAVAFTLATVGPTIAITSPIAGDNIINKTEAAAGVTISGTVAAADTASTINGQTATITIVDSTNTIKDTLTATVSGGAWSVNLTAAQAQGLADGTYTVKANVSDTAGNAATTATQTVTVDETAPTIAITSPVAGDNIINKTEAAAGVSISGTVAAGTASTVNGQTATITIVDSSNNVKDTLTTTVSGGAWSVHLTAAQAQGLADGTYTVKANVSDTAGNAATTASQPIAVDTLAPTVTIGTAGTTTNQATQTISGTVTTTEAAAGGTVTLFDTVNGVTTQIGTATLSGGTWSTTVTLSGNGANSIVAQDTDVAGNVGNSSPAVFTLATVAPTVTITAPIAGDNIINKTEAAAGVTITGTATAGIGGAAVNGQTATITIVDSTNAVKDTLTATVSSGSWSVNLTAAQAQGLADGSYTVKANVSDTAGNAATTATKAITVDETAPTGGTPDLATAADSGTSNTDNITNVTAPSFSVALGAAVAVGDTVQLLLGGSALAHPVTHTVTAADVTAQSVTLTVTAGDLGADGTKAITAQFSDAAGNTSTTAALNIALDTTAPTGGTPDLVAASDSGTSSTDNITNVTAPSFAVALNPTVVAGDTVQLLLGGSALAHPVTHTITAADVTAQSVTLAVTAGDLGADGTKSISAQFIDAAGNTSTTAALNITLDTTAPTGGTPDLVAASDSGTSNTDNITDVTAPSFTVALGATVAVGDTVQLLLGGSALAHPVTHTVTAADVTAQSVTLTVTAGDLGADGTKAITAQFGDAAGNTSTTAALSITLDTTAPTGGTPDLVAASDSGTSNTDNITDVTAPSFTVALNPIVAAGDTVQLLLGGSALAHPVTHTITAADVTAQGVTLTVTAGDLGADGTKAITAQFSDAAGNTSTTAALSVTLDTTAPLVAINGSGGSTNQVNQAISGTVDTADIGTTVTLFDNGSTTPLGTVTVGAGGVWSTTVTLVGNGTHSIVAQDTDAAGNIGSSSAVVYTLNTTAPSGGTPDLVASSDSGTSNTDNITNVTAPTFTIALGATAVAGDTIQLLLGGSPLAHPVIHTITAADVTAQSVTLTVTAGDLGADGTKLIAAQFSDSFGNTTTTTPLSLTLDTTAPTGGTPDLVAASDSGTSSTDNITDVTAPSFTVALGATVAVGDTVQLLLGGSALAHPVTHIVTATDITTGSITLAVTAGDLGADGAKSISAQFSDAAGNTSTTSALSVTLDTTAPTGGTPDLVAASDSGTSSTDNITNVAAPSFTVALNPTVVAGDTVQLLLGGTALAHPVIHTITAADVTAQSVTLAVTAGDLGADGTKAISAQFSDAAGNTSTTSALNITLDTTAPTGGTPDLVAASDSGTSSTDNITDMTAPSFTVALNPTVVAGDTVQLLLGGSALAHPVIHTVTAADVTAQSVTLAVTAGDLGADGTKAISAQFSDAAGNTSTTSALSVTLDTTAPTGGTPDLVAASDSGTSSTDNITNVAAPSFTVALNPTVVAGDTVQLLLGGSALAHPVIHTITAADILASSVTLTVTTGDLGADGTKAITAQFSDTAGNTSTTSALSITLDTTAPLVAINGSGGSTNQVNQAISGTVDAADIGTTVTLFDNGSTTPLGTTTVGAGGVWSTNVALVGNGTHSIVAHDTDAAGNIGSSSAVVFNLNTTAPSGGTPDLVAASDSGTSSTDNITNVTAPSFTVSLSSTVVAGDTVQLLLGGSALAHPVTHVITSADVTAGSVMLTVTAGDLGADGTKLISAQLSDTFGNTTTTSSLAVILDTTVPSGGTPDLVAASDSGASNTDNITDVTAPSFTVALGASVAVGDTVQLLLGGTALAHPVTHTITASDLTTGSITLTVTSGDLGADGTKSISAQFTDTAGNTSTTSALSVTLDTTAPTGGTPDLVAASDSGTSSTDNITDVTAPSFTVGLNPTVVAGDTVQLLLGGAALAHPVTHTITAADVTAQSVTLTVTAGDLGADGAKSIAAQFSDAAGNTSTTSTLSITLDTIAPTGGTPDLVAASDSGTSSTDNITDVTAPSFTVALNPTVVAGDTVQLLLGGAALAHPVTHTITAADILASSVTLTVTAGDLGADGAKSITAQFKDTAGNISTTTALVITLDTTTPTGGTPDLVAASDSGTSSTDNITNVTAPTFTIALNPTVVAGDIVQLLLAGAAFAHPVTHIVTAADITANSVTLTVTAGDLGADGAKSITAQFSDAAGNTSTTTALSITLDTAPPNVTISVPGGPTTLSTQAISGTVTTTEAAPGGTVLLFDTYNGVQTQIGTATLSGGAWSTTVTLSGNGTHSIVAEDIDAAGNTGISAAVVYSLTVAANSWANPGGGSWTVGANWSSGTVPSNTANVTVGPITATAPYSITISSGSTVLANSLMLSDPFATLVDDGTLSIAASLSLLASAIEIENGGTLSIGSAANPFAVNFAGTGGNLVLGNAGSYTGTVTALSIATGTVGIAGSGNLNSLVGDALDLTASGGTQTNPSNLVVGLTGTITGAATGIDVIQNAVGNITVTTSGSVTGQTQRGILAEESATGIGSVLVTGSANVTGGGSAFSGIVAENLNTANANTVTVSQTGNVTGGTDGIKALTNGTGNVAVTTGTGATITGTNLYGIEAFSNSTGNVSVTTATNDTIFSGSVGINVYNQATSIPQTGGVTTSTINVTAAGTIDSGFLPTGSGSLPAGILAGYKGGTTTTPNSAVFGDVTVNNSANITAAGGDGIRAYNFGSGNVTVNDLAGTTITANDEFGIEAFSAGSGKISITTDATDIIDSGASGLLATNQATSILASLNSTVSVTAKGTIHSGAGLNGSGSQPQGVSAGYFSNNGNSNTAVNGTVFLDNFANVTAAAGWGLDAYNYGNGNVTLTDEANTTVSGAQFGIGAYSNSSGTGSSGSVTVNVGNNATISSGSLYGLVGIQATASNAGSISITTTTGDIVNSGGMGIQANNQAGKATSASQISITTAGTINSGYDINQGGGQPGGIWAGYNPSNAGTVNSNVVGSVIVDNSAVINAPAGAGIGLYNYGIGTVSLTLEATSAITSELWGVNAAAQGGGNLTIVNKGSITDVTGVGITANIGANVPNSVSGVVSINNSGTITALGSSNAPVIQINNTSTQAAIITNSGTISATLLGKDTNNQAVAVYNGTATITNTGTISGNVSLNGGTFNNNAGGIWNMGGSNYFGNSASAIVNAGIINILGLTFLNAGLTNFTLSNSNTVNVAANADAFIGAAVSGTGNFTIGDRAELEFASSVAGQTVSFTDGNGLLVLDSPAAFSGSIAGLAIGDAIELQQVFVTGASVSGSTLTVQTANNGTLTYHVSGNLTNAAFDVLSGNEIVLLPQSSIPIAGSSTGQGFTTSTAQFYTLTNAAISASNTTGLNITSTDSTAGNYLTVAINQGSQISTTGAFSAINLASTADNIELINWGTISSPGGTGISANSTGGGSVDIIDNANVTGAQTAISGRTNGPGTLNIDVGNGATITSANGSGIFAVATSSGNIEVSTTQGATVNSGTSGIFAENQGTTVGSAGSPSSILVTTSGNINSGSNPGTGEPAGILAFFLGGTTAPGSPPNTAVFGNITVNNDANITANTGMGINASNYGIGDITVIDESGTTINATAAGTTAAGFTQYGIGAFNYGSGKITVTTDFGSTINSGGAGIDAVNQATAIAAAAGSTITVIATGAITSGANLNNSGSAPAGILAGYNPGNAGVLNANVTGNVLVEYDGTVQNGVGGLVAGAGDGISAFNYGIGNVEVDLGFNASITALNLASAGSTAPFGVSASNRGTGNVIVNMSNGDVVHSGSTGINANNQDTSISAAANSMIVVTAAGTITSGTIASNNGSQASGISAGYLGAGTANTGINGTVIVDNNATINASAGSAINAYNFGNGNVTVNDGPGTTITGGQYGISAYTEGGGTGNLSINVGANATITATNPVAASTSALDYGIHAFSTDAGNISVITSSGDNITANGTGINAVNEATAIAQSVNSSIVVTANGTINSGTEETGTGSPPGGIVAGYLIGNVVPTTFPLTTVFGDVEVNNFATIKAAAGDGIRAYDYGIGDVEVNELAGSITLQGQVATGNSGLQNGYGAGIAATNGGSGNIDVTTAAGTSIDSSLAGSGISAINKAPGVPAGTPVNSSSFIIPATSHISVVAHGTIVSGMDLAGSGDVAAGILAGYNPNNGDLPDNNPVTGASNIHGTVFIDDFGSITAAAGTDGIRGINYGDGTITIIAEAGAVISAGEYGIAAIGGDGGNITITNSATLTGGTAAIHTTTATPTETVTIENLGHMTGVVLTENAAFDNGAGAEWDLAGASTFASGTNTLTNEGIIDSTGTASITATTGTLAITNTGTVNVQSGSLDIGGPVTGTGQFTIGSGDQLEFTGSVSSGQTITFEGSTGTLKLDDPTDFHGQISGLTGSDGINLAGFDSTTVVTPVIGSTQTTLTVTDDHHSGPLNDVVITLLGNYTGSSFNWSSVPGGVLIVDPPAATPAATTITATGPNQTLTGTGTPDNFVFNFANVGQATVTNFHADTDVLEVKASLFANLQAVVDATHDDANGNAVVTLDSHDSITLTGVSKAQLNQTDFHLA